MGNRRIVMPVGSELSAQNIKDGIERAVGKDLTVIEICLIDTSKDGIAAMFNDLMEIEYDVIILHTKDDLLYKQGLERIAVMGAGVDIPLHMPEHHEIVSPRRMKASLLVASMGMMMQEPKKFEEPIKITMPYRMREMEMLPEPQILHTGKNTSKHNKSDFGRNKFNKKTGHRPRY